MTFAQSVTFEEPRPEPPEACFAELISPVCQICKVIQTLEFLILIRGSILQNVCSFCSNEVLARSPRSRGLVKVGVGPLNLETMVGNQTQTPASRIRLDPENVFGRPSIGLERQFLRPLSDLGWSVWQIALLGRRRNDWLKIAFNPNNLLGKIRKQTWGLINIPFGLQMSKGSFSHLVGNIQSFQWFSSQWSSHWELDQLINSHISKAMCSGCIEPASFV